MSATLFLSIVCLALCAALASALSRLYEARLGAPPPGAGRGGLDELLGALRALQERGAAAAGAGREEVCALALEGARRFARAAQGRVLLLNESTGVLTPAASSPHGSVAAPASGGLRPGEGVSGRAFQSAAPLVGRAPEGAVAALPMMLGDRAAGVLELSGGDGVRFDEEALRLLSLIASSAAAVLSQQQMVEDLQTFYLEMVQSLARAVNARDAYTSERAEESRRLARALAAALGLPEPAARHVEFATLLHNVGKIGVDQALLSKPGKLTPEEFEQIKRHTVIGHGILAPVRFLGPVARIVLYQQEWFNGRGYPEGLRGEEIPLGSRIVAVIIAWEAMNSDRPYRKRLGAEEAMAELRRGAGSQFDPRVVEAFLRLQER